MIIKTERLVIREFIHEDIDLVYDINNDPECIKFNSWNAMSYEDCEENIKKWINQYSVMPGTGAFCVESITEDLKVGMAFIIKTNKSDEFEIGFRLRRRHWSNGYAKEITREFINYAKEQFNAHAVIAEVYTENVKSRNVFEKLGFSKYPYPDSEDGLIYKYTIL